MHNSNSVSFISKLYKVECTSCFNRCDVSLTLGGVGKGKKTFKVL